MEKTNEIPCPECDKMLAVHEKSQAIGEFLEWLRGERGITLAEYRKESTETYTHLRVLCISTQDLLAEYFEIDLNKVEQERRALLENLRGAPKGVCLVLDARKGNG